MLSPVIESLKERTITFIARFIFGIVVSLIFFFGFIVGFISAA